MGLLKNLSLLFSDSLLNRMSELENRQDLLEEHTAARLDSMKAYSARVVKRERDARRTGAPQSDDLPSGNGRVSPAVMKLLERRQRRHGAAG